MFDSWYENPLDLPGRWYLQAIRELFKENRLAKGEFVGLGRRLNLKSIACPVYLLAGESDDITTKEQVFAAENLVGTPKGRIEKKLVARRTHRSLHGLAHAQGDVADDRAVANSIGLRLTLARRDFALVDPVGGTKISRANPGWTLRGSGTLACSRDAFFAISA